MRLTVIATAICFSMVGLSAADSSIAAIRKTTNIPAEGLGPALTALAKEYDFQVLYRTETVGKLRTGGVSGMMTAAEALEHLLRGTGLAFRYLDEKTVTILPANSQSAPGDGQSASMDQDLNRGSTLPEEGKKSSSDEFRLAQANSGSAQSSSTVNNQTGGPALTEIIVTAQKRSERLQDVPVPVTALDAADLAANNQTRLQDYFASVPGLSLNSGPGLGGQQTLAIRGITTGAGNNPTVGVTIDGVPYGSSSFFGDGSLLVPDIDPGDLARIEVLRGPQGTLYGANSMGGLINFVTAEPSTDAVSGRVQVLGDGVEHGEFGYGVRASANVPISETVAIRASGFMRRDPGYIDNVTTGQKDVNQVDASGGLLSALWRPSGPFSVKLSALLQDIRGDGSPAVDTNSDLRPLIGDLKQARLPGTEGYRSTARLYTATLNAKLGGLDLISISGYGVNRWSEVQDVTGLLGACCTQPFFNVTGASNPNDFETKKFSQELRLSSPTGDRFDWLVGAFYTHESTPVNQSYVANNAVTGQPVGVSVTFDEKNTVSEYALFGDVTVHFTDQFDVQFGGRESENRQTYDETDTGPLVGVSPYVQPTERTKETAFTYLVTPRFKITPDLMMYARFASGYRPGGPNLEAALYGIPLKYDPDKTNNYELGLKGALFDRALTFDASLYYIDWQHVQVFLTSTTGFVAYFTNAGSAKSQGAELSVQARPTPGLTLQGTVTVSDAHLTEDLPPNNYAFAAAGDRLPFSSRFSGAVSANQDFTLTSRVIGFAGASLTYVGNREGEFAASATQPRLLFPGYAQLDVRGGARFGPWTANLFVNNVADKRGIVSGGVAHAEFPYAAVYIQPRTVGLSLTRTF